MFFTRCKQIAAVTQGMRALLRALVVSFVVCVCIGTPAHAWPGIVTHVSDGDTVWVQPLHGGEAHKVRLLGIDAPEICQTGGLAARDALATRVLRQVVTVNERQRDHYGRALVHLTHQGEDVGAWLVVRGHAWAYHWRYGEGVYAGEERQARAQKKGLFADRNAEVPRDFRRRHGPCPLP